MFKTWALSMALAREDPTADPCAALQHEISTDLMLCTYFQSQVRGKIKS